MANITETSEWIAGIYQLETVDVVEGGLNGTSNLQAKQLASRTKYLKDIRKGTTAERPTVTSNDIGKMYFDTTLNVNGKPIWFNGVNWVDSDGNIDGIIPALTVFNFSCSRSDLTTLTGVPTYILGNFDCSNNLLTSLEGCPLSVGGNFYCFTQLNNHTFTEEEVRAVCNVGGQVFV